MLATAWRPYIETCIEAFGADRSMFESKRDSTTSTQWVERHINTTRAYQLKVAVRADP
jgi:hypothetical protein